MSEEVDGRTFISPMTPADLKGVMGIEKLAFSSPWPRSSFVHELKLKGLSHSRVFRLPGCGLPGDITGYVCFWHVVDEVHVTNLAVHPDFRRRGIATGLIRDVLRFASEKEVRRIILEVRRSNLEAQNLYRNFGFVRIGVRRNYYTDTSEDALVMELVLP